MGLEFGHLYKMRGIVTYKLSPFELKTFAGVLNPGFANVIRRVGQNILKIAPPYVVGYLVYDWANKEHVRLQRKVPSDYENDE